MKYEEWFKKTQISIDAAGLQCAYDQQVGGWEENHITTQLLKAIGKDGDIRWEGLEQRVKWSAYKLSGNAETQYGDVAVIVKVHLAPEVTLEGVAFYEAKRQYFGNDGKPEGFNALKKRQLSTISLQTHASHVLLYDIISEKKQFAASAVPTEFVRTLLGAGVDAKQTLSRYGYSWLSALGRNLRGFDLDYRKEAVDAVRASAKNGLSFILNAAVSKDHSVEPTLDDLFDEPGLYESIDVTVDSAANIAPRKPC